MKKTALNYITDELIDFISELSQLNWENMNIRPKIDTIKGVYFLIKDGEIVYVGKSQNILERVMKHQKDQCFDDDKIDLAERFFINKYKPFYNNDFLTKKIKG